MVLAARERRREGGGGQHEPPRRVLIEHHLDGAQAATADRCPHGLAELAEGHLVLTGRVHHSGAADARVVAAQSAHRVVAPPERGSTLVREE